MKFINIITCTFIYLVHFSEAKITNKRETILKNEAHLYLGGKLVLTEREELVNTCLMHYKLQEITEWSKNMQNYNFSKHFFEYKSYIKRSRVYKIIRDMPKGAVLHIHDMAMLGPDYLVDLTYTEGLYTSYCDDRLLLKFATKSPTDSCKWHLMSDARKHPKNTTAFDAVLRKYFTLVTEDPDKSYPSSSHVWDAFMTYYFTVEPLLTYRPVWEKYFYDALKAFREENILYVEIRSSFPKLYELDGVELDPLETAMLYEKIIDEFVKEFPDFIGAKLIFAPFRHIDNQTLDTYLELARNIKKEIPNHFAGFDLVGREELGGSLVTFSKKLSGVKDLDFFFHAGETNWNGFAIDENLIDAIVLGSKRIGQPFALTKHPVIMNEVIKREIGIEISVISNTVMHMVKDVRNHPLSVLLSLNVPVVLSSDNPGVWEADLISDDFYVAFVGAASQLSDMRLLKTFALNSLKYSALNKTEKTRALVVFQKKWNRFINGFDCSSYNPGTITFLCRKNAGKQDYCIQYDAVARELEAPIDIRMNDIMKYLNRRYFK